MVTRLAVSGRSSKCLKQGHEHNAIREEKNLERRAWSSQDLRAEKFRGLCAALLVPAFKAERVMTIYDLDTYKGQRVQEQSKVRWVRLALPAALLRGRSHYLIWSHERTHKFFR